MRIDDLAMHKALFAKSQGRILPADVGRMTLAEILTVLDDADRGPPGAVLHTTIEEAEAAARSVGAMTPLERLDHFQG